MSASVLLLQPECGALQHLKAYSGWSLERSMPPRATEVPHLVNQECRPDVEPCSNAALVMACAVCRQQAFHTGQTVVLMLFDEIYVNLAR